MKNTAFKFLRKLSYIFLILFFSLFYYVSCENSVNKFESAVTNALEEENSTQIGNQHTSVIIKGTFDFDGALPAFINGQQATGKSDNISRTAMPVIPSDDNLVYSLNAKKEGATKKTISSESGDDKNYIDLETKSYAMEIPLRDLTSEEKKWTFELVVKNSTNPIMSDTYNTWLSEGMSVFVHNFVLIPVTGGSGQIHLTMTVPAKVSSVEAVCDNSNWTAANPVITVGTGTETKTVSIDAANITGGRYSVRFNFKDSNNLIIYSDKQSINVLNGCSTETWLYNGGTSPVSKTSETDLRGPYTITTEMLQAFELTTFYVGPTDFSTTSGTLAQGYTGSPAKPLSNIAEVCTIIAQRANSTTQTYTIFISGTITGTQSISDAVNGKAASITLCGATSDKESDNVTPKHKLNGAGEGTTLTVETTVPLIIEDLLITGGSNTSGNGGGIVINNGTVELTDGAVVNGNTAKVGGGIYLASGSLYINGSAVVGKPGTVSSCAETTSGKYGNKATIKGGGIAIQAGTLWLGYAPASPNPTVKATTGGVIYNLVNGSGEPHGGGIDNANGTINFAKGKVAYNYCRSIDSETDLKIGCGGGISNCKTMNMSGDASVEGNIAAYGGGIYLAKNDEVSPYNYGNLTMSGGSISSNQSKIEDGRTLNDGEGKAGGLAIGYNATFTMSGGSISSNTAEKGGGAIVHNGTTFIITGNTATIPAGTNNSNNILFWADGRTIEISGATGHSEDGAIAVTLYTAARGTVVLTGSGVSSYYSKFKLTNAYGMKLLNTGKLDFIHIVKNIYVTPEQTDSTKYFEPASGNYTKDDSTWNNATFAFNASETSSQEKPFKNLSTALKFITYQQSPADYVIYISGAHGSASIKNNTDTNNPIKLFKTQTQTQTEPVTAASIKLVGVVDTNPKLDANNNGTVLQIDTEVPVTLENLTITRGNNTGGLGGGIHIYEGSDVTLSSDVIVSYNKARTTGGGIHNAGLLKVAGAKIFANQAENGGGIANIGGTVYIYGSYTIIGDNEKNVAPDLNSNTSDTRNKASTGGGIYNGCVQNKPCLIIIGKDPDGGYSSPKIKYNYASNNRGGGIHNCQECTVEFHQGTISYNSAGSETSGYGGGICNNGIFIIDNAGKYKYIESNDAVTGGAIYMIPISGSPLPQLKIGGGNITMGSGANGKNTVYLGYLNTNYTNITITKATGAGITIDTNHSVFKNKQIIVKDDAMDNNDSFKSSVKNFYIKQPATEPEYPYFIGATKVSNTDVWGYLKQPSTTTMANASLGDIVLKDGTVIKYEEGLKLGTKSSDAIAIIFYNGTELGSGENRVLGMTADLSSISFGVWSGANPAADVPELAASVSGTTFSGSSVRHLSGKDNYSYAWGANSGIVFNAMKFCSGFNQGRTDTSYTSGWYLPSISELYKVYENIDTIDRVFKNVLGKTSGIEPYTYIGGQSSLSRSGGVRYIPYWSSNTETYSGSGDLKIWCVYLGKIRDGEERITSHEYDFFGNNSDGGVFLPIRQFNN